jgi:hypothetical protein
MLANANGVFNTFKLFWVCHIAFTFGFDVATISLIVYLCDKNHIKKISVAFCFVKLNGSSCCLNTLALVKSSDIYLTIIALISRGDNPQN